MCYKPIRIVHSSALLNSFKFNRADQNWSKALKYKTYVTLRGKGKTFFKVGHLKKVIV